MIVVNEWNAGLDRPVTVPFLHVGLADQVDRLKQESTWRTTGRNAITLTKEPTLRLVLLLLGKRTKMPEPRAAGPLTLHVLSGSVRSGRGTARKRSGLVRSSCSNLPLGTR